eukprot:5999099-Lingulodinium_polyedra.AAC.1
MAFLYQTMATAYTRAAAVVKQSPEQTQLYCKAVDEWDHELQRGTGDSTYVPELKSWSLQHH